MRRAAIGAMAAYYMATGAWPLVHLESFEALTGPKTDEWLVHMVGALAVANGVALAAGARRREPSPETLALAIGSAAAFAAIDIAYVARRRIRPIYLADAALELLFALTLTAGGWSRGGPNRPDPECS